MSFLSKLSLSLPQGRFATAGAVAAAGLGAAALALYVARALLRAPDGPAHANDDQRALLAAAPFTVGSVRSDVLPSAGSALDAAAETLAAGNVHDPMHVACTSVVRRGAAPAGAARGRPCRRARAPAPARRRQTSACALAPSPPQGLAPERRLAALRWL
jgi:hypothetical protein